MSAPGVLSNDTDIDSTPLSVQLTAGPSHGALTLATDGSFTYSPVPGYWGPDSFSYAVSDGQSISGVTLVTLTVSAPAPDILSPVVAMTSPAADATVSGAVAVTASATDNVAVVSVQFLLDGAPLGAEDTTFPYSMSWNSTGVANGAHQLSARARDAATNQTTAVAVSVTVNNVVTPPPVAGLVAAYSFNEGSGGTLIDRTGNGRTGTLNGPAWTPAGKFGGALSFDGLNDWVTVADANALDLTTGMTIEAWVYPTASGGNWRNVLIKERTNGEVYNLYTYTPANVPSVYVVRAAQTAAELDATGTAAVP